MRYPTGIESYEIPAGGIENEELLVAAQRELKEETGLMAEQWKQLATLQAINGISNAVATVFLASKLQQTGSDSREEEGISETLLVSIPEAFEMIHSGAISCSQSIAAITVAAIELNKLG